MDWSLGSARWAISSPMTDMPPCVRESGIWATVLGAGLPITVSTSGMDHISRPFDPNWCHARVQPLDQARASIIFSRPSRPRPVLANLDHTCGAYQREVRRHCRANGSKLWVMQTVNNGRLAVAGQRRQPFGAPWARLVAALRKAETRIGTRGIAFVLTRGGTECFNQRW